MKRNKGWMGKQELGTRLHAGLVRWAQALETAQRHSHKDQTSPQCNPESSLERQAEGRWCHRWCQCPCACTALGRQDGNWRRGSTRCTKVIWRLKSSTAQLDGGPKAEGSRGLRGCRGGSPRRARAIPWDGHGAAGHVPSRGLVMVQSDTTGANASLHPVLADTVLLLLQQLRCLHQSRVTRTSHGSIADAPTPPTPQRD